VRFGEIPPMTPCSQNIYHFFIMMSLTVFAYWIKELTQFELKEKIFEKFK